MLHKLFQKREAFSCHMFTDEKNSQGILGHFMPLSGVKHYFCGIDFWKFCQSSTKNSKNEIISSCKSILHYSSHVKPTQNFEVGQEE